MQREETAFLKWQVRFGTEEACVKYLFEERWGLGFICTRCGHDQAYFIAIRKTQQCSACRHQVSITAGTLFHSTNLPLTKWFWAIFLVVSDKGGISAVRLSKYLDVSWPTARLILRKIRTAMGNRDSLYRLSKMVEVDDALVGGKRSGKRGRGAEGKTPVLIGCENRGKKAGFIAMESVLGITHQTVGDFAKRHLGQDSLIRSDALPALNILGEKHSHEARITPAEKADEWLPWVHIVISNMKRFILGTYHGVSAIHLQEYLNEFCYRFNRRIWEPQLPNRLLTLCVQHTPVMTLAGNS